MLQMRRHWYGRALSPVDLHPLQNGVDNLGLVYLAKIVCFAEWVKGANCVSSDFLNEKVLMIVTYIILKIKAQLK